MLLPETFCFNDFHYMYDTQEFWAKGLETCTINNIDMIE